MLRKNVSIASSLVALVVMFGVQSAIKADEAGSSDVAAAASTAALAGWYPDSKTGVNDSVTNFWFPYSVCGINYTGCVSLSAYPVSSKSGVAIKHKTSFTLSNTAWTYTVTKTKNLSTGVTSAVVAFGGIPVTVGTSSAVLSGSFNIPNTATPTSGVTVTYTYQIGTATPVTFASNSPFTGTLSINLN